MGDGAEGLPDDAMSGSSDDEVEPDDGEGQDPGGPEAEEPMLRGDEAPGSHSTDRSVLDGDMTMASIEFPRFALGAEVKNDHPSPLADVQFWPQSSPSPASLSTRRMAEQCLAPSEANTPQKRRKLAHQSCSPESS